MALSMPLKLEQLLWLASFLHYTLVIPDDAELEPSRSAGLSCPTELHMYRMTEVFVSVSTMVPQLAVAERIAYWQRMKTGPDVQVSFLPSVRLKSAVF